MHYRVTGHLGRPLAAASAVLVMLLSACNTDSTTGTTTPGPADTIGQPSAELIAAAKSEGSLTFYAAVPQAMLTNITNAFQAKYGITVNSQMLSTGPLAAKLQAELDAGNVSADVVDLADFTTAQQFASKNAYMSITSLPAYSNFPASAKDTYAAQVALQPFGIVYNTDEVKDTDLKTWQDAVSPRFKGKVSMIDIRPNPSVAQFWQVLDKQLGDDFLRQVAALDPTPQTAATPTTQQVVSGGALIAYPDNPASIVDLVKQGAPLAVAYPSPTTGPVHYASITAKAPHPNAAKLFLNFLLTVEGQTAYNSGYGFSAISGIPGLTLPDGYVSPPVVSQEETARLTALLGLSS